MSEDLVIATLVRTAGSTYRKPGAELQIDSDGKVKGLISGGCLESEIMRRCQEVFQNGQPLLLHFDLSRNDDLIFGFGLGCQGEVWIWLEKPSNYHLSPSTIARVLCIEDQQTELTGQQLCWDEQFKLQPSTAQSWSAELIQSFSQALKQRQKSQYIEFAGRKFFIQHKPSRPCFYIFGAGADAPPLSQIAHQLHFDVHIRDHRPSFIRPDRFSTASSIELCRPEDFQRQQWGQQDGALIMNHHLEMDEKWLATLARQPWAYIGLLGPQHRKQQIVKKLKWTSEPKNFFAPAGLRLGSDGPEEIALSVLAEYLAVIRQTHVEHLRDSQEPIHLRQENIK